MSLPMIWHEERRAKTKEWKRELDSFQRILEVSWIVHVGSSHRNPVVFIFAK